MLKDYRSWSNDRLQPVTFSAELMICCSLPFVLGSGSSVPGSEDGLNVGGAEEVGGEILDLYSLGGQKHGSK